jgi:hypothetical protein
LKLGTNETSRVEMEIKMIKTGNGIETKRRVPDDT